MCGHGAGSGALAVRESAVEKRFVEIPALPEQADNSGRKPTLAAKLRIKGRELEVYVGADETMLAALVQILKDAE